MFGYLHVITTIFGGPMSRCRVQELRMSYHSKLKIRLGARMDGARILGIDL